MRRFLKRLFQKSPLKSVLLFTVLMLVAFAYAMFQGGFVSWFLFYTVLPIFLYMVAVASYPLSAITVEREVDQHMLTAGESLQVKLTMKRQSPFPLLFLIVHDHVPETWLDTSQQGSSQPGTSVFFPGFRRQWRLTYTVSHIPRGEYHLDRLTIKTGDLFGFIQKQKTVSLLAQIFVYPVHKPLRHQDFFQQNRQGQSRGQDLWEHDMTTVSNVRDYAHGDRLVWMDWKATARNNKLLTKEFEKPLNGDMLVCLDYHRLDSPEDAEVFEAVITVSASIVHEGLEKYWPLGFASVGSEHPYILPVNRGGRQRRDIFHHLARVQQPNPLQPIDEGLLQRSLLQYSQQTHVIYVSASLDPLTMSVLQQWRSRRQMVTLFYIHSQQQLPREIQQLKNRGIRVYVVDEGGRNGSTIESNTV